MSASSAKHAVVRAKLKFTSRAEFVEGFLPLVSSRGLFIRTKATKPRATPIRFEFRLDDDTPVFVGEGVVRTELPYDAQSRDQPYGMLVSLRKLNRASKEVLDEILALKAELRAAREAQSSSDAATPPSPVRPAEPPTPAAPVAAAPSRSEQATPPSPVRAAAAEPLAPPAERVYRPEPDPSLPRPQLLSAPPDEDEPDDELAAEPAHPLDEQAEAAGFGDPVPEAAPVDVPTPAIAEPEAPAQSIFGGDDDDDDADPFGDSLFGDGLEDELDGIFAEAGMVSDGSFDPSEGPADLFGSAVHFSGPGEDEPAELEDPGDEGGGGGLISLGEDELDDDDDDFFDDDDFEPASAAEPTTPVERPEPSFFEADDDEDDVQAVDAYGDPVPEAAPLDEPAFAEPEPSFAEPEPEPEPEDVDEVVELLDADELDEVDEIDEVPAPTPATTTTGGFQFKLKAPPAPGGTRLPPPRLPPPRLPPPPGRKPAPAQATSAKHNPLDDVSVANTDDLPPPPAPASFKNPSINDIQGDDSDDDKAGGGLFNKLFGKES